MKFCFCLIFVIISGFVHAEPTVSHTELIGPFTGHYAPLHPDNLEPHKARYYGTDLGFTYSHKDELHFLFGDTMGSETQEFVTPTFDDIFGSVDLKQWSDPAQISPDNIPLLKIGQVADSKEVITIDPGHAMEGFKTPLGGFSNGTHEFGIFYSSKPQACVKDSDCGNGFSCDTDLGYVGNSPEDDRGLTFACVDDTDGCMSNTISESTESGICIDPTSSTWAQSNIGRASSTAVKQLVGIRDTVNRGKYTNTQTWLTHKFSNPAIRTAQQFSPSKSAYDFSPATAHDGNQAVLLWGRPGFIGVGKTNRDLALYFAYADMPEGPDFNWRVHYFTGTNNDGSPRFSDNEREAVALDLDFIQAGEQPKEKIDVVDQMSVAWVEPLQKWLMFYGGGMVNIPTPELPNCGVLELFTGSECDEVEIGKGSVYMRTADFPWGPWTPPQEILIGGDPTITPVEHQYAEGGVLHHPQCSGEQCETHTQLANPNGYGFLYAANIIEEWTRAGEDGVDIIWNVSTWDPYRVVLFRTRILP